MDANANANAKPADTDCNEDCLILSISDTDTVEYARPSDGYKQSLTITIRHAHPVNLHAHSWTFYDAVRAAVNDAIDAALRRARARS